MKTASQLQISNIEFNKGVNNRKMKQTEQTTVLLDSAPPSSGKCLLLEALLAEKGFGLKGTYTYPDLEKIFECSKRSLQDLVRDGRLRYRELPGRAHWLSVDLEEFLQNSLKTRKSEKEK